MYTFVLALHSWIRWLAIIAGVVAVVMAFTGRHSHGTARAARWGRLFITALDIQLLLGVLLYFVLSPNTKAMLNDFGAAMRDPLQRFWAVEHAAMMMLAVIVAHAGSVMARKARSEEARRTRLVIAFTIATLAMLAAIPWPGMSGGRPLFRI